MGSVPTSRSDPTARLNRTSDGLDLVVVRRTPGGVTALRISVGISEIHATAHGADPEALHARWQGLVGLTDPGHSFTVHHRTVAEALRRHGNLRLIATSALYEELLCGVLGQRITGVEAAAQWRRLCVRHGFSEPSTGLWTAPDPGVLSAMPYHDLHGLGIERRRAETLRRVARLFHDQPGLLVEPDRLRSALTETADGGASFVSGVGRWTAAVVLARTFGDADAVAVGDWHLKNLVAHALAARARGTDAEMLELLEPYKGNRNRVLALLAADGLHAPRFGPRRRILHVADM
jgi:3-methyladenine DNA glycosylase/8-oxoguanine DNA glycosylase